MASRFKGLWRHPDFLRLWSAQAVSLLGSGLGALPFAAIFFLDASGQEMAILVAATTLPALAFGLFAGAWADRLRRRPLLIAADLGRAAALLTLPAAAAFDALAMPQLYAVALVAGTLDTLFAVASISYLPTLVPRERLVEANSKLTASASVAEAGAFSVGGWLVQLFGAMTAVVADALSFLFSATMLARIRTPEARPTPERQPRVLQEVGDGARAVVRDGRLAGLAASGIAQGLAGGLISSVILLFGNRELGLSAAALGMIFGVGGVTALAGSLAAGRLTARFGIGRALLGAEAIGSLGILFIVFAGGSPWAAGALLVASQLVSDPARAVRDVGAVSVRQVAAGQQLQGRVNATFHVAELGAMLVGAGLAAVLAPMIGLRATLAVGAAAGFLAPVAIALSPAARVQRVDLPESAATVAP